MTPEPPEPPTPTLPEITVNVSNAKGVRYLNPSDASEPDVQTYDKFTFENVEYTVRYGSQTGFYLAIPRSANDGDTIQLGYCSDSATGPVFYDEKVFTYQSGSGSSTVYSVSAIDRHPNVYPVNAELSADINGTAQYILRVVQ